MLDLKKKKKLKIQPVKLLYLTIEMFAITKTGCANIGSVEKLPTNMTM